MSRHMRHRRPLFVVLALALIFGAGAARAGDPQGQLTWGVHTTLAPTWFDPAETSGIVTPYMVMYALHDAMLKPMPGQALAPALAESWTSSEDALSYEFILRKGVRFHNGDEVTAEDVKFSFERYRGAAHKLLKDRVAAIEIGDARHIRFQLKKPWPDFLTYYVGATGAGWIVPKKYVERVGDDGFKKAPVGAGPYKFVSFTPGQELILEAFDQYWRKTPNVKRLVLRLSMTGELAEEVERTRGLTPKPIVVQTPFWLYFADQWDAKSPWHDQRVRLAASLAIDRAGNNQALTQGYSKLTGSIIPESYEYFWAPPAPAYDPAKAKQLLADAGYPNGFDAGDFYCDLAFTKYAEPVLDNLRTVGIRARLRPLERAAFYSAYGDKSLKNIVLGSSGAYGNAATRLEAFVAKGGTYVYGSYPDIDALFEAQAGELDRKRREALLHKIQQLVHDRAIYAPIWQLGTSNGLGSRVGESGLGLIAGYPFSAPYEDLTVAHK